ncbi:hypothetical protein ACLB2K_013846 [Fragaria x ananassa]
MQRCRNHDSLTCGHARYLEVIGRCCPRLKSLEIEQVNNHNTKWDWDGWDGDAFAIAGTMQGLQHLQLFGNRLTSKGLRAMMVVRCLSHLICVNVGIINRRTRDALKLLVQKHQIPIIFLSDTHCTNKQHLSLQKAIGFPHIACYDRVDGSGGLALLWDDLIKVSVRDVRGNLDKWVVAGDFNEILGLGATLPEDKGLGQVFTHLGSGSLQG